jgi:WD40 repeat protein
MAAFTSPVKIAPAGESQVLLGLGNGAIALFDCKTGSVVKTFTGKHEGPVTALAVSPDQKYAFTVGVASKFIEGKAAPSTPTMRMWDVITGIELLRMDLPGMPNSVDVSPGGKYVLLGEASAVHHVELARLQEGGGTAPVVVKLTAGPLARIPVPLLPPGEPWVGHKGKVNSVVFSRKGKLLLSACADGTARLWDTSNGMLLNVFTNNNGAIQLARFGHGDRYILAIGAGPSAHYWKVDPPNDEVLLPYPPGKAKATCGDVSSDGKYVMLAGANWMRTFTWVDGKLTETQTIDSPLRGPDGVLLGNPTSIVALGAPKGFAIGTSTGKVCLWNVAFPQPDGAVKGQLVYYWNNHTRAVLALACHATTKMLASVSADHSIVVRSYNVKKWKVRGAEARDPVGHGDEVTSVDFSPNGVYVVTGSKDRTVRFWTHGRDMLQLRQKTIKIDGEVRGVAYSPDGRRIAVCGEDIRMHPLDGK